MFYFVDSAVGCTALRCSRLLQASFSRCDGDNSLDKRIYNQFWSQPKNREIFSWATTRDCINKYEIGILWCATKYNFQKACRNFFIFSYEWTSIMFYVHKFNKEVITVRSHLSFQCFLFECFACVPDSFKLDYWSTWHRC